MNVKVIHVRMEELALIKLMDSSVHVNPDIPEKLVMSVCISI